MQKMSSTRNQKSVGENDNHPWSNCIHYIYTENFSEEGFTKYRSSSNESTSYAHFLRHKTRGHFMHTHYSTHAHYQYVAWWSSGITAVTSIQNWVTVNKTIQSVLASSSIIAPFIGSWLRRFKCSDTCIQTHNTKCVVVYLYLISYGDTT